MKNMKNNLSKKFFSLLLSACMISNLCIPVHANGYTDKAVKAADADGLISSKDIVAIDDDNFPDENFRKFILDNIDKDSDKILSKEEISSTYSLNISNMGISDISGIKVFSKLKELDCSFNRLSDIDLSNLSSLTDLNCSWNNLKSVNLKGCDALTKTDFDYNAYLKIPDNASAKAYVNTGSAISLSDDKISLAPIITGSSISVDALCIDGILSDDIEIAIDDTNFPDDNFRDYILKSIDTDHDNKLNSREISETTYIYVDGLDISDLKGINIFQNLVYLSANDNQLQNINLKDFKYIVEIFLNKNNLAALNASDNDMLSLIECNENAVNVNLSDENTIDLNSLEDIDVAKITNLSVGTINDNGQLVLTPDEADALASSSNEITYSYDTGSKTENPDVDFVLNVSPLGNVTATYYTVTFDAQGGSFENNAPTLTMQVEAGTKIPVPPVPVKKGYSPKSTSSGNAYWYTQPGTRDSDYVWKLNKNKLYEDITLYVYWIEDTYNIRYSFDENVISEDDYSFDQAFSAFENEGGIVEDENYYFTDTYTVNDSEIILPKLKKPYSRFEGWFTEPNYTNCITSVKPEECKDISLYAKFTPIVVNAPELTKLSTSKKGYLKASYSSSDVKGYKLTIATDSNFKKNVSTVKTTKKSFTFTNCLKKKYYVKVQAYAYDDFHNIVYSDSSNVLSANVKSGVKEYPAKSNSASIKSCKITSGEEITVTAKISKRIKSSDSNYYLVKLEPSSGKITGKPLASSPKLANVSFVVSALENNKANVMAKYAIAIKDKSKYKLISNSSFVSNPQDVAANTFKFPQPASKKGIQAQSHVSANALNAKHTLFNLNLNELISRSGSGEAYTYNGKTYYFHSPISTDVVKYCNRKNISVSFVLLMPYDTDLSYLIHPKARKIGKNYYLLNTTSKKPRETLEAAFMYLTEKFSQQDCYVSNWILGNEVNIHSIWNYAGNMSLSQYAKEYASAYRILYYAAKSNWSNSRCYISLDHSWNNADGGFGGKEMLSAFNSALKKENKSIQWNLAYHAYPVPLTDADFWNNGYTSNKTSSDYITLKNINVLTKYIQKQYGKNTRIILSEQGFTSSGGQDIQAAAIAYGYYLSEFNSMIDAFIIRSDVDFQVEVDQGLAMGIIGKKAEDVFKYMDTPDSEDYTLPYLKTIKSSAKSWKSIVPSYKASKFKSMPAD